MRWLKRVKGSVLAGLINRAYSSYGFVSAFIYGPQGIGKTTYALKVLYGVYGDWGSVLDNTYFYIDGLVSRLRDCLLSGDRIKAVLIDDAGVHLVKYSWRKNFSVWFSKFFNLIRTTCSGVLFTSVEVTDIIKFVRDKIMYRVSIRPLDEDKREAVGYKVIVWPSLQRVVKKAFIDVYTLSLPLNVKRAYEEMRREAIMRLFNEVGMSKKGERDLEETSIYSDDDLSSEILNL